MTDMTVAERKRHGEVLVALNRASNNSRWLDANVWAGDDVVRIYPNSKYRTCGRRGFSEWQKSKRWLTVNADGSLSGRGSKNAMNWADVGRERLGELVEKAGNVMTEEVKAKVRDHFSDNPELGEEIISDAANRASTAEAVLRMLFRDLEVTPEDCLNSDNRSS